jgi:hypothetical protein
MAILFARHYSALENDKDQEQDDVRKDTKK